MKEVDLTCLKVRRVEENIVLKRVNAAALEFSLRVVPEFSIIWIARVLKNEPIFEVGTKLLHNVLIPVDPEYAEHDIPEEQEEKKEPVDIQELLVELNGADAANELKKAGLEQERRVGVDKARLGQSEIGNEHPFGIEDDDFRSDDDEAHDADEKNRVACVDPEPVVPHSPVHRQREYGVKLGGASRNWRSRGPGGARHRRSRGGVEPRARHRRGVELGGRARLPLPGDEEPVDPDQLVLNDVTLELVELAGS